ncbi:MAG: amino acid ABC transporter substrate-binding protein [Desulfobacteraceae bacterium]|nr:amino acid ABC transporter substrate-binding protein [Desulfobacteraceae bacterium]
MRNYLTIFFLLFLLILPARVTGETLKIGASLSLTGKYAQMGKMQKKGFDLWVNSVNKEGGILGKEVKFIILDDQSSKETAKAIYNNHIKELKVDFLIGPYSSAISEAILPIAEKYKYPILLSGASADRLWEKGYRYAFGVYTPASKYTVGFLQMLVMNELKNIAIVSVDDSFSTSLSKNTIKWAKRLHLNIVYTKQYSKGETNLSQIASKLKSLQPDAVIVCGHLNESLHMRQAMKAVKWYPRAYYASVGPALNKFFEVLGPDSELSFSSSQWEKGATSKYPFGSEFVQMFNNHYAGEPSYHAATAYAAGMILKIAINKVGSLDSEKIRDTLSQMDTMTVIGRYGVDQSGKQKRHFPMIIQWQQGKKKVVWPEGIKTADPIFNNH